MLIRQVGLTQVGTSVIISRRSSSSVVVAPHLSREITGKTSPVRRTMMKVTREQQHSLGCSFHRRARHFPRGARAADIWQMTDGEDGCPRGGGNERVGRPGMIAGRTVMTEGYLNHNYNEREILPFFDTHNDEYEIDVSSIY